MRRQLHFASVGDSGDVGVGHERGGQEPQDSFQALSDNLKVLSSHLEAPLRPTSHPVD